MNNIGMSLVTTLLLLHFLILMKFFFFCYYSKFIQKKDSITELLMGTEDNYVIKLIAFII